MQTFAIPSQLFHGQDALKSLAGLSGSKAIVVTGGKSMQRLGFLDTVVAYLQAAGMDTQVIDGVEPDPSMPTIVKGAKAMQAFEPDWIIALGGGSAIDAAKAMWIFYEHPTITLEQLADPTGFPKLRGKARLCAIPSTSGTASEVTGFSIVTDPTTGIKHPLGNHALIPDVAIIDPALVQSMPKKLIANTGMDALSHAVESYVSVMHSEFTDALALHAIKVIHQDLKQSWDGDLAARARMHSAQCLAGMAFNNGYLGISHSLAHKTGAIYKGGHIAHGAANAIYLPKVIQFNTKNDTAAQRYAQIASTLGLAGSDNHELVASLIAWIRLLSTSMEMAVSIQAYEGGTVSETEFLSTRANVAIAALSDPCTYTNPRSPSQDEMEGLLTSCFYDTKIIEPKEDVAATDNTYETIVSTPMGDLEGKAVLNINGSTLSGTFTLMGKDSSFANGAIDADGNVYIEDKFAMPIGKMPYTITGILKDGKVDFLAKTKRGDFVIRSK
jgi:alcohol dehydrogenase class IV